MLLMNFQFLLVELDTTSLIPVYGALVEEVIFKITMFLGK